jgi:hypothetical protein
MQKFTGFDDLAGDLDAAPVTKTDNRVQYPCTACAGSGFYRGVRMHQVQDKCFACNGRGYFLTSPEQRRKGRSAAASRRAKAAEEKQRQLNKAVDQWKTDNAGLHAYLISVCHWNNFAQGLLQSVEDWGGLTDGQRDAAVRMQDKHNAREADKEAELADKPTIDLTRIKELFDRALASGLKKPVLRLGALSLKLAPKTGKNPGCTYVFDHDDYAGKVTPDGKFIALKSAPAAIEGELIALASDPLAALTAYGKRTGNCSCCGRPLTNPVSVAAGIGPICAGKWGL